MKKMVKLKAILTAVLRPPALLLYCSVALLLCCSVALAAPFIDNGSTATDQRTGLNWQKQDDGVTRTWGEALSYCEGLSFGGHSDWRLPNIMELESITDDSRYNPAIDPVFTGTDASFYWSSTTDAINPDFAWFVYFSYGLVYYGNKNNDYYVRCVRAGQSGSFGNLLSFPLAGYTPYSADTKIADWIKGKICISKHNKPDMDRYIY